MTKTHGRRKRGTRRSRAAVLATSMVYWTLRAMKSGFLPMRLCQTEARILGIEHNSQRGRPTKMRLLARQTMVLKVSDAFTLVQSFNIVVSGLYGKCWEVRISPAVKGISSLKASATSSWTSGTSCGRDLVSCPRIIGTWYGFSVISSPRVYLNWSD